MKELSIEPDEAVTQRYRRRGAVVLRNLVDPELLEFLTGYLNLAATIGCTRADPQLGGAVHMYGDRGFDALLVHLTGAVQAVAQVPLLPTYSFVRVYSEGDDLPVHTDRPACENSVSVHLSSSQDALPWSLFAKDLNGDVVDAVLHRGDALVYRGGEVPHWRESCPVDWYAQIFLHYVDATGPASDEKFDRRPFLGMPRREGAAS